MKEAAATRQEEAAFAAVGDRLRAARAKIGMTRKQLAAASDTSERYLAHLEGGVGNPSLGVLTALANALDLAVADLLPDGGERSVAYAQATAAVRRLPADGLGSFLASIQRSAGRSGAKGQRIVLVGLRGAGKSTLGQTLATRLDLPFLEVSKEVERAYGGPIGLLIELSGQSALRRYENEAWEAIRSSYDAAVIAAPGGIVADAPLYDRVLATAHSVWLRANPEDHMSRVMAQGDFRPMASNRAAMADLKTILEARTPDYARADVHLDTSAQGFEVTADMLAERARSLIGTG